ncbi:hypothetical protein ACO2Q3_07705 [Caulobacter sp. KR2-114]|uniref:hypothetical protein n=1 Tax=Caulobacter sp. KR2-114 TaxID=3400912 RepID=UPI003C0D8D78
MTIIYIENLQGSGKTVKVIEDFGDYAVHRDLAPGEHACIGISRLKTLQVQEVALGATGAQPERRTLKSIREVMAQTPALANTAAPTSLERRAG